jgi:glycosyltransferase involved in cell wall biosynthesis
MADALVLPSKRGAGETWGLVVNEAMQYGLLPIVSDGVGCHVDLVKPGKTGWVFGSGKADALAHAIMDLSNLESDEASAMRSASIACAKNYSLDTAATGLAIITKFATPNIKLSSR